ncbi:MAG: sigma 54-interacting transcriptional regulator [Nitrospirota bacterium]
MISGYKVLEEIHRSRKWVVFRGQRDRDRATVLIKTLIADLPAEKDIAALKREYEILQNLRIDGIPKAYGLERQHNRLALILEDIGGEPLRILIDSQRIDLVSFLKIAIELSGTLAEVHQNNFIHNDINPNNIVVDLKTNKVRLVDFTISSFLLHETPKISHPSLLEGTLAYLSPEQTGRMNRAVDYRTDFYSLGVTFFEMLTGRLPFDSMDPLELVHFHIAKIPAPPCELNPDVPQAVSSIVVKLLAKTAEERYQSAYGLKADLEACLAQWQASGTIGGFTPGRYDFSDQFLIPQRLYGRERELETLLAAFEQVAQGTTQVMLVSGYSGIGKSTLVNEVHKPIVERRGYFISGKFDQFKRSTPYSAIIQAFQELVRQLLTESEEQIQGWKEKLIHALGPNGQVIIAVIPEVELVIGPQPAVAELPPVESQNRFNLVFQRFLQVFTQHDHPLVVFLDDLQWADPATLNLLQLLLTSPNVRHLFLIGAYRDNEVDSAHPLMRTLSSLKSAGVELHRVTLEPLQLPDLTLFIRDTLHGELAEAAPLAALVFEKTDGNPFFVIQFLKTLKQEGFLEFDYAQGRWAYRIDDIAGATMTDNVIDLMTRKIQRLSNKTQRALTLAACIGNQFDQDTLAIVSEQSQEAVADDLKEAINQGLILSTTADRGSKTDNDPRSYAFLHDRVQQAAYALIPAERQQIVHLTVGRLLLQRVDPEHTDETVFDVVHHLNLGRSLITEETERVALARLNLSAGRKAKSSTAYVAARDYLKAGLSLLGAEQWESRYDLAFALHLEAAACLYLCGHFDEVEQQFESLLQRARSSLDKARVYNLRSVQYENMSRYADALAVACESLALFGVSFPDSVEGKQAALESEIESIRSLLGQRRIESLIDLPVMIHPETRMVMTILTDMWSSAYIIGEEVLARLISATMVRLSLLHGNLEESAYGYVTHAITVGPVCGDYESAYEFGRLALRVNERFNDSRRRAKIHQQFHAHVNLWRQPIQTCIPHAREACRSGLESGDFLYAAYGASTETWSAIVSTQDLAQFVRDYTPNLALIKKLKIVSFGDALMLMLSWVRALQGETRAPLSLSHEAFDENEYAETYRGNPFFTTFYAVAKLHLFYVFGEYGKALETARTARGIVYRLSGTIWPVMFDFWTGLTLAANYADATEDERRAYFEEMEKAQTSFAVLAQNCPENFLCQALLLSAEIERIAGRHLAALDRYEHAIRYAGETNMLQHRALASELCAKFWLGRGQGKIAAVFMDDARTCYAQWGAAAKVAELEHKYPDLLGREANSRPLAVGGVPAMDQTKAGAFDLFSVMKAAQVMSSEIELEELLAKLMRIAIENAGAERGSLMVESDGELFVRAEGAVDAPEMTVHEAIPLSAAKSLPKSVVNYVKRTSQSVVLADAVSDQRYAGDPYITERKPRSILCTPVINQGRLVGILYLENNLTADAFTPDRVGVMQMLSSQAAVSLENARLYDGMKAEIAERKRAEEGLRAALVEVEQLKNRLQAEKVYLQEEIRTQHNFGEIVGASLAMKEVFQRVERVAHTETTVLVSGETGTGKELIARAIHNLSARKQHVLVTVNCGTIPAGLVESELFGHEKGAFTGATARRKGRFELADGGTIFLDEIGELPLDMQTKLLRVLQEHEFERVGGTQTLRTDVRVIAATNRDLEQEVRHGAFRADLLYRLNIFPIHLPALRERAEDIPLLIELFVRRFSQRMGKRIDGVGAEAMGLLTSYHWPGNVRELANVIERAVILCDGPVIQTDQLHVAAVVQEKKEEVLPLDEAERMHILKALEKTRWMIGGPQGAALLLGINRTTLLSRMKKLGINRTP